MEVKELPNDDCSCGWYETLPPPPPARRLAGAVRADCAVIGAGFTGLAVARRLASLRPDWRVALLEAERVGLGASGRNSGVVVDVWHYLPSRGVEGNRRLIRLARAGRDALGALVRTHGIDCAWGEYGRLHGAAGDRGVRALETLRRGLDLMGEAYRWLDAPALRRVTGSAYYRAAIHTPGGVLVQPAALARGLAAALPANVDLFEESPVQRITLSRPIVLRATTGAVTTDRLFLAVNGFTSRLGFLRQRIFPLLTFASLTRVLTPAEEQALAGEREWGLVPEDPMGTTVRRTRDHRILIRNSVRYGTRLDAAGLQAVGAAHREAFRARFPMLPGMELAYTWGGVLGMTSNTAQWFGRAGNGVWIAAGCNGAGVALGTALGALLADLAVGADSALLRDAQALPRPGWLPPEPLLRPGVAAALRFMAMRSHSEI
jgi:glycine/D-amino acid oxidase-like deaminating enzyme